MVDLVFSKFSKKKHTGFFSEIALYLSGKGKLKAGIVTLDEVDDDRSHFAQSALDRANHRMSESGKYVVKIYIKAFEIFRSIFSMIS